MCPPISMSFQVGLSSRNMSVVACWRCCYLLAVNCGVGILGFIHPQVPMFSASRLRVMYLEF